MLIEFSPPPLMVTQVLLDVQGAENAGVCHNNGNNRATAETVLAIKELWTFIFKPLSQNYQLKLPQNNSVF
ncbi:hypothetical protein XBJ2_1250032 [Xenorhabdus bovienii str. Jollieti]|uniref:Uncharacterized protein n=1 Tax=Xenorhabdus bovienii (strain SS-2004) TaxID=406818 RepID=D3V1A8_XENBS|nr:hypothetical protein XBJ1_2326 [Xenorhabdus bovienii SS-2004]CDH27234.1 hypothetical protein XBJ2_1250032 [Xenorhabdus bovienii str. Jollieti]